MPSQHLSPILNFFNVFRFLRESAVISPGPTVFDRTGEGHAAFHLGQHCDAGTLARKHSLPIFLLMLVILPLFPGCTPGFVAATPNPVPMLDFIVQPPPLPPLSPLTPSLALAGGIDFTLTVTGSGFIPTSIVKWNGSDRLTTYVSATQITAIIMAADIRRAGTANVTVVNPAPGGGPSPTAP